MAELKYTIPDARMQELIDAWGSEWEEEVNGVPNPITKQQFAKDEIKRTIADRVRIYKSTQPSDFPIT